MAWGKSVDLGAAADPGDSGDIVGKFQVKDCSAGVRAHRPRPSSSLVPGPRHPKVNKIRCGLFMELFDHASEPTPEARTCPRRAPGAVPLHAEVDEEE